MMHHAKKSTHSGYASPMARQVSAFVAVVICGVVVAASVPAESKENSRKGEPPLVEELEKCLSFSENSARLQCFDAKVGALVSAKNAGEVQIVSREDITTTKRQLFGFSLPKIGLFSDGGDADASATLETTVRSARYGPAGSIIFTTPEGGTWEILQPPRRLARVQAGDQVEFKRASFGSYFIRINGQMGVKGRRIQ